MLPTRRSLRGAGLAACPFLGLSPLTPSGPTPIRQWTQTTPHVQAARALAGGPGIDGPSPKEVGLIQRDVFAQDVHAGLGREASRPSSSSSASRASCTASVTAALQILPPPQRFKMKSHDNPRST